MLTWIIIAIIIIFADQLTKWLAIILFEGNDPYYLIDGVLRFVYVENDGAAFGMLDNHRWVFLVLSTLTIIGLMIYLWRYPPKSVVVKIGITLIIGGGIGNMIDRVALGYVVDFIDFCAFPKVWMWVFNIADSCICIGVGVLIIYLLNDILREFKKERAKKKAEKESVASTADGEKSVAEPETSPADGEKPIAETETPTEGEKPKEKTEANPVGETPEEKPETPPSDGEKPIAETETSTESEMPEEKTEANPASEMPEEKSEATPDGEKPGADS